jgi:hypothetical protein
VEGGREEGDERGEEGGMREEGWQRGDEGRYGGWRERVGRAEGGGESPVHLTEVPTLAPHQ